jgi:hypothetical protein
MATRLRRWIHAEWPFFAVVGLVALSVVYLLLFHGHWRRGAALISAGVFLGAGFRATMPPSRVGLLVVRSRLLDSVSLAVLGGVILSVAIRLH